MTDDRQKNWYNLRRNLLFKKIVIKLGKKIMLNPKKCQATPLIRDNDDSNKNKKYFLKFISTYNSIFYLVTQLSIIIKPL